MARALSREIDDLATVATGNRYWYRWAYGSIAMIASGVALATMGGIVGLD